MKLLGADPGIRGAFAIVSIDDGAAPRLVEAIDIGANAKERADSGDGA